MRRSGRHRKEAPIRKSRPDTISAAPQVNTIALEDYRAVICDVDGNLQIHT